MTQTVNKRGRPLKEKDGLSAEIIINTAKAMMLAMGKVPSIRAISSELNVDPMALYYYFNNKNALLEAMAKSLIAEIYAPTGSANWQQELSALAKSYLTLLSRYDGLLQTLLSMSSTSPASVFIARFNLIVSPLQLGETQEKAFLDLLVDYLHGFSLALANDKSGTLTLSYIDQPLALLFQGVNTNNL